MTGDEQAVKVDANIRLTRIHCGKKEQEHGEQYENNSRVRLHR